MPLLSFNFFIIEKESSLRKIANNDGFKAYESIEFLTEDQNLNKIDRNEIPKLRSQLNSAEEELTNFRSIVVPYIKSTIVVVGTYMVVTVLKAFDIIYVSTRGDLETNLLAVKMLDEFSKYRNFGRSSTVAVIIFICVLPVIIGTALRERDNLDS